jgi:hypothetical protein
MFESGYFPTSWGSGIIVLIFKGGAFNETKNYRGITLINIIAKIYSQVLLNRLTKWSSKYNKIIDNLDCRRENQQSTVFFFYKLLSIKHYVHVKTYTVHS